MPPRPAPSRRPDAEGGRRPAPRNGSMLTLARVRGVPVMVSPSWLLIGALLVLVCGPVVNDDVDDIGRGASYLVALGFTVLFAGCILAHELGHTLVSIRLGYPVTRVVLFVLGGVSEIEGEPTRARHELAIAAAGPLVSLVISGAAFGAYTLVPAGSAAAALFVLLAWSNVVLAGFNLLPGLPLDGGRILRATAWGFGASQATSTRVAAWAGRGFAVAIAIVGLLAVRGSNSAASSVFVAVLAGYLWVSASAALRLARLHDTLPMMQLSSLLRPGLLVPADLPLAEALQRLHDTGARGLVLVDSAQRPTAIVEENLVRAVPQQRRPWTPLREVAHPLDDGGVLALETDAPALLEHIRRHPRPEYLVVDAAGLPAGVIASADVARELQERIRG